MALRTWDQGWFAMPTRRPLLLGFLPRLPPTTASAMLRVQKGDLLVGTKCKNMGETALFTEYLSGIVAVVRNHTHYMYRVPDRRSRRPRRQCSLE